MTRNLRYLGAAVCGVTVAAGFVAALICALAGVN